MEFKPLLEIVKQDLKGRNDAEEATRSKQKNGYLSNC